MGSGIRSLILNERYTGLIRWNTREWRKDPVTGKRQHQPGPPSEWCEYRDESLRIIPDSVFERAQERTRDAGNTDMRLKSGGRARYLLSGLNDGDPDLEPDDIQAAIDKAEHKRRGLLDTQPASKRSAEMIAMLPKAAAAYRRQIAQGLDNDPRAAGKARAILRKLLGTVRLVPERRGLWAEFEIQPATLLKAVGSDGSGGRI